MTEDTLVLGLGNILLQDDGIGVRVIGRFLEQYQLPEGVKVLDGGVRGLSLLPYLQGVSQLLIVDAIQSGKPAGAVSRLVGDEISKSLGPKISIHQEGLADLLWTALATDVYPAEVVLWGVEPARLDTGLDMSPAVAKQVDTLVEAVYNQLIEWDHEPIRRPRRRSEGDNYTYVPGSAGTDHPHRR